MKLTQYVTTLAFAGLLSWGALPAYAAPVGPVANAGSLTGAQPLAAGTLSDLELHVVDFYAGPDAGVLTFELLQPLSGGAYATWATETLVLTPAEAESVRRALAGEPSDLANTGWIGEQLAANAPAPYVTTYRDIDGLFHTVSTSPKSKNEDEDKVIKRHAKRVKLMQKNFPPAPPAAGSDS